MNYCALLISLAVLVVAFILTILIPPKIMGYVAMAVILLIFLFLVYTFIDFLSDKSYGGKKR